jgi:putative DNA primase/helicase
VLTITLDPACETPATRRFKGDPLGQVQRQRALYVGYALTIVRAYVQAGYPAQSLLPLNSYGQWTQLVRSALVWLGIEDPATAIFESMNDDPDTETLGRILALWHAKYQDRPIPLRIAMGYEIGSVKNELYELLREVGEYKGLVNSRRIGRWIARKEGRLVNGMRFERDANKTGGSERWRVVVLSDKGAVASQEDNDEDGWDLV